MKRRLLVLLLVLAMLLPTLPMGTLAEDGEAQETTGLQTEFIKKISVTAKDMLGVVEVDVTAADPLPASEGSPVYLVAATFDQRTWQMVDSAYLEVTDDSSMLYTLHLYNTQEGSPVRVFALDKDLQSLTTDSVTAEWETAYAADGQEPEDPTEEITVPEEPVETVPEETEETVPETIEETVPETTEETVQEPEETLTPEAAAEEGYYVAPEGARLQEDADLEEMAAYFGSDKTSKGLHTASFTGLVPQAGYTFLVSSEPGSLEDLKYIWLVASDANGEFSTAYVPKDEGAAIVQLYGPEKLTLTAEQDYITLQPGKTAQIRLTPNMDANIYPDFGDDTYDVLNVYWDGEDSTIWGVSIREDFLEKLQQIESRYITFLAYDISSGQEASVKVRVDLIPEDSQVEGASLGETTVTHNYYSSEATPIPVFLEINVPDREDAADTQAAFDAAESTGFIRDAAFSEDTPEDVKKAFEIRVQDDHTLLLATKEIAETADGEDIPLNTVIKNLKSSYNVGFVLTVNDNGEAKQLPVTGTLKLNVQKKLPTLKADAVTLNTYAKPTGMVTITGGEVKDLVCEGTDLVSLVYNEENGTVIARLRESTTKSSTVNLTAQAVVAGYNQPITVKIPVKIDAKAPTFKLEKTSIDLCSIGLRVVEIPVQCTTKGIDIGDLEFGDIVVTGAEGYEAFLVGDVLYIVAHPTEDADGNELGRAAGKQNLTVQTSIICGDIETPITWKLTVNNVEPTLKLNKSSLLLNVWVSTGASLKATIKGIPENWEPFDDYGVSYDIFDKNGERVTKYFDLSWDEAEGLFLEADSAELEKLEGEKYDEFLKGTYTLIVGIGGTDESKWSKVTLKLEDGMPTLTSVKAAGTIDLNNDDSRVTLTPTFKNKLSVGSMDVTVTDADGNEYAFNSYMDGDKILIGRAAEEENLTPGTYTATVTAYWFDLPTSASTTFKVVKNKPTIKVTGKLDSAKPGSGINIYSSYRHYDADGNIQDPEISLASSGKESFFVDKDLYYYWTDENGNTALYPVTYMENLIPAGKYTLILTYGDGGETGYTQTTSINITQTAGTLKLSKTSVTIHPDNWYGIGVMSTYTGASGYFDCKLYHADGKTEWTKEDQALLYVGFEESEDAISLIPTGNIPEKDTTIKVKLTPDTRMPNKFSWLTVKVLGGKSLEKKLTLKATGTLDPSYSYNSVMIQATPKGFDNNYFAGGTLTLLESSDNGKTYHEVNPKAYRNYSSVNGSSAFLGIADYWTEDYQRVRALDPNCKYRAQISYGGSLTATVDLKLAYGKNKFTVAQAPTLYKKDPRAEMDIHIDQQDMGQQIVDVTIKGNTGFTIKPASTINGSYTDWTLKYEGDVTKLKTTTLTLQVFLKSNETAKPNATVSLKVNVK